MRADERLAMNLVATARQIARQVQQLLDRFLTHDQARRRIRGSEAWQAED